MKVVTLWEPWATLMASGAKRIETRSWPTSHRGVTAIHAAKRFDFEQEAVIRETPFRAALLAARYERIWTGEELPLGCVVALGNLVACIPMRDLLHSEYASWLTDEERAFGDYTLGRFAWVFREIGAIEPIPARGAQGIWDWTPPEDGWQARILADGPEIARDRRAALRRVLALQGHRDDCRTTRGGVCTCRYNEMVGFLHVFRTQRRQAALELPRPVASTPRRRAARTAKSPHVQPSLV